MAVLISLQSAQGLSFFDLQVTLDGATYTLAFRWNVRAQGWFLDVWDEQGVELLRGGVRVVADYPLMAYVSGRSPPGQFVAVDTSGKGSDPALDDLGRRVQLYYFTSAELALLG